MTAANRECAQARLISETRQADRRTTMWDCGGGVRVWAMPLNETLGFQCSRCHGFAIFAPEWYADQPLNHPLRCRHIELVIRAILGQWRAM